MENLASVIDAFEIKPGTPGSRHAPGLVVVIDGRQCAFRLPRLGATVELLRPDGTKLRVVVSEMKEHGDGRTPFFAGATKATAPIGTVIAWSDEAEDGVAGAQLSSTVRS